MTEPPLACKQASHLVHENHGIIKIKDVDTFGPPSKMLWARGLEWHYLSDRKAVCYQCLNNSFQYLNNIICIFTHFFIHMYFQKTQTTLVEISYQTSSKSLELLYTLITWNSFNLDFLFYNGWFISISLTHLKNLKNSYSTLAFHIGI